MTTSRGFYILTNRRYNMHIMLHVYWKYQRRTNDVTNDARKSGQIKLEIVNGHWQVKPPDLASAGQSQDLAKSAFLN